MKFIDAFPTVIFTTDLSDISLNEVNTYKNFITNENQHTDPEQGAYTNTQQILNNNIFDKLNNNILNLSRNYLKELGHTFEDIQISSSWANTLDKTQHIHNHVHKNSYISGVYYVSNPTPIFFENELLSSWNFIPYINPNEQALRKASRIRITPSINSLIIFPSWLPHFVPASNIDQRISIAFNIIPKGDFGYNTQKLYL